MLRLEHVNKYFNRHKRNEIHVINDTSLKLDSTGLVAFLGPSGCGKTTLLNAIGGLDKIDRGKIYINGKKMPKRGSYYKDKMRVLNVGYIFQDYNLLENLTVFENVALTLKMIGIKNRKEIKKRVDYVLEKVGIYRYRNKPAGMLSGGEKQRVGIARAIVKNPAIVIADEPTGNLDSKNTIEIMNIIKSISEEKLVILVTHEKNLADFYASRIIDLEDGKIISDKINDHEHELDYRIDNKIYLKDFKSHEKIEDANYNLDFYSDDKETIDLDIVIKNGNLYIKSNNIKKVEIIDENSSIEFIDEHYKKITKEDYTNTKFSLDKLDNSDKKIRYSSIYNVFTMLRVGIKKVFGYPILKKILLIGFFIAAMFTVYSVSNIFGVTNIKDEKFVTVSKEYIKIENAKNAIEEFTKLESDSHIDYVIPGNSSISMSLVLDNFYQFSQREVSLSMSIAGASLLNKKDILIGRLPENENEIVIDKRVMDVSLESAERTMIGYEKDEKLIGKKLKLRGLGEFTITGITDKASPCGYVLENKILDIVLYHLANSSVDDMNGLKDYSLNLEDLTIKKGHAPLNLYEVIVPMEYEEMYQLNKTIDTKVNGQKLKVVGYYSSKLGSTNFYIGHETFKYKIITETKDMTIYSKDKESTLEYLKSSGYNAIDVYSVERDKYIADCKDSILQAVIIAGILLFISFIEIFLMIRASFMSRIKEVGIYRAIGTKKSDIYKMFMGEIIVITSIASVPGFILMSLILKEFTKISMLENYYMIDARIMLISLILIYGFNIIVGLLPVVNTIRKTPAEILARTDVD